MIRMALILLAALLPCAFLQARNDAPLPVWDEKEHKELEASGWLPGAALLTDEPEPDSKQAPEPKPLDLGKPTAEEVAADQSPPSVIPEKHLASYFDARPATYLIDPQNLLSSQKARDRLDFLNNHARDSSIDLFIYVFGKDQEIPGEVREEELIERFFAKGRPAMIVYYYLGGPQQSVLYLSPSLTDVVSAAEQRRALQSSVMQALEKSDPQEQLEAFTVQMSIRIYWMERMLSGEPAPGELEQKLSASRAAKLAKPPSALAEKWARLLPVIKDLTLPGSALLGAVCAILGVFAWLRWRASYRFPKLDVEPRLGGDHAAGVGAVISFSSAALPPASQRDQVPDYARRR